MSNKISDIAKLGAIDCADGIKSKKFSAVENVKAFAEKVQENKYNAFITNTIEQALEKAKKIDNGDKVAIGGGKLAGVVFGVKDVFCTKGIRTTCGSRMLENFIPQYNATVWENLENEGAILIGKTNMDEFSMGSTNKTSYYGYVENPYRDATRPDAKLVPGGSSGGSASAVASDSCNVALGGDTGGSIRQPASFCNLVGVRPTYGRCSRNGLISYASSLDQAGVLAKNVDDATLILDIMSGNDKHDSTMLKNAKMNNHEMIKNITEKDNLDGITIGIPVECKSDNLSNGVAELWQKTAHFLEKKGAKIQDVSIAHMEKAIEVYYIITTAEAFSNLARFDGVKYGFRTDKVDDISNLYSQTKIEGFGDEVKRRILTGAYVLSSKNYNDVYVKATKIRRIISDNFKKAFQTADILLLPVSPTPAFAFDDKQTTIETYLNDIYTVPSAIAGLAGISVPAGFDGKTKLPIGMQLVPKFMDELTMFKIAKTIEIGVKNNEV